MESTHCKGRNLLLGCSWGFAKGKKELQQSIDFSKLLTKLVIIAARYIISSQFIDFHTFTALTFQTKASSLVLRKCDAD